MTSTAFLQTREELIQLQNERELFKNYDVRPYVAFIGDLSCDGVTEEHQENLESNSTDDLNESSNSLEDDEMIESNQQEDQMIVVPDETQQNKKAPEVFVVINSIECKVPSNKVVDAVQYCLKCIVALNNEFPPECKHVWEFICSEVCKLGSKKRYTIVKNLVIDLKSSEKKN